MLKSSFIVRLISRLVSSLMSTSYGWAFFSYLRHELETRTSEEIDLEGFDAEDGYVWQVLSSWCGPCRRKTTPIFRFVNNGIPCRMRIDEVIDHDDPQEGIYSIILRDIDSDITWGLHNPTVRVKKELISLEREMMSPRFSFIGMKREEAYMRLLHFTPSPGAVLEYAKFLVDGNIFPDLADVDEQIYVRISRVYARFSGTRTGIELTTLPERTVHTQSVYLSADKLTPELLNPLPN
jgi:hypothetical protein